jgi:hypothetical protein
VVKTTQSSRAKFWGPAAAAGRFSKKRIFVFFVAAAWRFAHRRVTLD